MKLSDQHIPIFVFSERCHKYGVDSYKMEGSCRAFWRCNKMFKSTPACCPRGFSYNPWLSRCVEDPSCDDFCGHAKVLNEKGELKARKMSLF